MVANLIDAAGWALVHFVWQGTAIGVAAALFLWVTRTAAAHVRYILACAALALMVAAPVVTATRLGAVRAPAFAAGPDSGAAMPPSARETTATPARSAADAVVAPPATPSAATSVLPAIVAAWLVGVTLLLLRLAGGWRRLWRLRAVAHAHTPSRWQHTCDRLAARLRLTTVVRVFDTIVVDTPTMLGWTRPVILLPVAALANLTPAQVEAILAHELAHIRRHDFLVNVLQTLAETLLFYHPAVWWISGRIRVEREHCCDDIAVDVCGDALAYAEALAELETWRGTQTNLAIRLNSGQALAATGGSLLDRVRRLLDSRSTSPRSGVMPARAAGMLVGSGIAIGIAMALAAWPATPTQAAAPPTPVTTIVVDDVRLLPQSVPRIERSRAADGRMAVIHLGGDVFRVSGFTVRELVRFAYQASDTQVVGGSPWMGEDRFDVVTRIEGAPTPHDVALHMRQVLAGGFTVTVTEDVRPAAAYALVPARSDGRFGPSLTPSSSDCRTRRSWRAMAERTATPEKLPCGAWSAGWQSQRTQGIRMTDLAEHLPRLSAHVDRPVVDRTNLTGTFDVTLVYSEPADAVMKQVPPLAWLLPRLGFVSIFTALEQQLGLRLVDTVAPTEVLAIAEAPPPVP